MNTVTNIATNSVPGFVEDLSLVRVPPWWLNPWFLTFAFLIAVATAFCAWRVYRRWQDRLPTAAPATVAPGEAADAVALRQLTALRMRMAEMSAYEFTTQCSQVLRRFIEGQFGLAIMYQTTREFLAAAQRDPAMDAHRREALGGYLHACDVVKFGRAEMSRQQMAELIDYAEQFVRVSARAESRPMEVRQP